MKTTEILTKVDEIENDVFIIRPETRKILGLGLRLKGDPEIQIFYYQKTRNSFDVKVNGKKSYIGTSIGIDISYIPKLIDGLNYLLNKEI